MNSIKTKLSKRLPANYMGLEVSILWMKLIHGERNIKLVKIKNSDKVPSDPAINLKKGG